MFVESRCHWQWEGALDGTGVHVIGCVRLQANYKQCKYKQTAEILTKLALARPTPALIARRRTASMYFCFWAEIGYIFISKLIAGYKSGRATALSQDIKA